MQKKVLVIEDSPTSMKVLEHLIEKVGLIPVSAQSLTEAQHHFSHSSPEEYLCAVVDYNLPDAPDGEAIDFAINAFVPTVVITGRLDERTRESVLAKEVVDYIPKENAQVFDYLGRLLQRLEKNKSIGVLVVDDSRLTRMMQMSLLRRHNFNIYEAADGEEGLNVLRQNNDIKLVITDENMPNMNGIEMVAEIRNTFSKEDVAIIGVSGKGSSALSARFIKSGANDYISKPYCHEEFFCRVIQNIEHIENIALIRQASNIDHLTGIPNRRHFFSRIDASLRLSPKQVAIAVMDVDGFKEINDTYGHQTGDTVLKLIAKLLKQHFKEFNYCRFGGEEFCVFFSGVATEEIVNRLEIFRRALASLETRVQGIVVRCTISIGVSDAFNGEINDTIKIADANLYKAKQAGKNQICH
ncbi:MAG: diguanylate cyclase [Aestuariibacter sp.]